MREPLLGAPTVSVTWIACAAIGLAAVPGLSLGWPFVRYMAACARRWWERC